MKSDRKSEGRPIRVVNVETGAEKKLLDVGIGPGMVWSPPPSEAPDQPVNECAPYPSTQTWGPRCESVKVKPHLEIDAAKQTIEALSLRCANLAYDLGEEKAKADRIAAELHETRMTAGRALGENKANATRIAEIRLAIAGDLGTSDDHVVCEVLELKKKLLDAQAACAIAGEHTRKLQRQVRDSKRREARFRAVAERRR